MAHHMANFFDATATGEIVPTVSSAEVGIGSQPDTTITGPNLFVLATTNYTGDTIDNVTAIDFDAPGAATATFSSTQFGTNQIALNATITGGGHVDTVAVRAAGGASFDGSQLQFANWGASDRFEVVGTGDHATITGPASTISSTWVRISTRRMPSMAGQARTHCCSMATIPPAIWL